MRNRRTLRMPGYDYAGLGAYFITICAFEQAYIFGSIRNGEMNLNALGKITTDCWRKLPDHFSGIRIDEWVVMPNHMHGIIWIVDRHVGATHASPLQKPKGPKPQSIGSIIGSFKSAVTNRARTYKGARDQIWQRNYHEHVIRDEGDLWAIRNYIQNNPSNWAKDEYATIQIKKRDVPAS